MLNVRFFRWSMPALGRKPTNAASATKNRPKAVFAFGVR